MGMKNKEKRHLKKSGKHRNYEENPKKQAKIVANGNLIEEGLRAQREKAEKARLEAERGASNSQTNPNEKTEVKQMCIERLNRNAPFPALLPDELITPYKGAVITTPRQAYVYEGPYTSQPYTIPLPYNVYGVLQTSVGLCAPSVTTSLSSDLMVQHSFSNSDVHYSQAPCQVNIVTLYNRANFQRVHITEASRVDVCIYHPHTQTHLTTPFLHSGPALVDHTSTLHWNKLVDSFLITSSHSIHTSALASLRTCSYSLPAHTHTHISAYCNDDLTTQRQNCSTAFIGMRNGHVHHVDFRQRAQATSAINAQQGAIGYKHYTNQVKYSVYGLYTLKDHQLCVCDIANQVYVLDLRHTRTPLRTLQPPSPSTAPSSCSKLVKAGVYVSKDRDILITQQCASPLRLGYYSAHGGELLGVSGVKIYDSDLYDGSVQFASSAVYGDDMYAGYDGYGCGEGAQGIVWASYARTGGVSAGAEGGAEDAVQRRARETIEAELLAFLHANTEWLTNLSKGQIVASYSNRLVALPVQASSLSRYSSFILGGAASCSTVEMPGTTVTFAASGEPVVAAREY
eukprot:gene27799-33573_t